MTYITISKKEFKKTIENSVREVLVQELVKLRSLAFPVVSSSEQKNIEKLYGKPSRKSAKVIKVDL